MAARKKRKTTTIRTASRGKNGKPKVKQTPAKPKGTRIRLSTNTRKQTTDLAKPSRSGSRRSQYRDPKTGRFAKRPPTNTSIENFVGYKIYPEGSVVRERFIAFVEIAPADDLRQLAKMDPWVEDPDTGELVNPFWYHED